MRQVPECGFRSLVADFFLQEIECSLIYSSDVIEIFLFC